MANDDSLFSLQALANRSFNPTFGIFKQLIYGYDGTNLQPLKVDTGGNQQINLSQINAVTPLMGTGTTGTGSPRVTIATDNIGIATWGQGATGSAVPSGASYKGLNPQTALPAAATAGNLVGATAEKYGRQIVVPHGMRDIVLPMTRLTLTASVVETTLVTAVASTFNDLLSLVVVNTSATNCQVDFRDSSAGTIRLTLFVPAFDTRGIVLSAPLPQNAVNQNWTAQCGTSVSSIIITGSYVANK